MKTSFLVCIFLFWLLVLGLAFLAAMPAEAHLATFTQDECNGLAIDMYRIAIARDKGAPLATMQENARKIIQENLGKDDSYLKDEEDARMVLSFIDMVYLYKDQGPNEIGNEVLEACTPGTSVKNES